MVPAGVASVAPDRGIGQTGSLAVLCGPTAVGKTALALALALRLNAEIIAADSRTIYRGLDIGTAKPTVQQQRRVPHHLLDVADPGQVFSVADYQRLARAALAEIRRRGRLPLLVGGTGLYIRAVVDNLSIPEVPPDHALRTQLQVEEHAHGPGHLHARLAALDPVAASRIDSRNVRRVIRALEVTLRSGRPISEQQRRCPVPGPIVMVGLAVDRLQLYRLIDARVDEQLADGLVEEVRGLLAKGVSPDTPSMQGLGYKEIIGWLQGGCTCEEAIRLLKRNTRRYAKRQLTWFRRDPRIIWVDAGAVSPNALIERVHAIMDAELSFRRRS